jgi:hypothetical protein
VIDGIFKFYPASDVPFQPAQAAALAKFSLTLSFLQFLGLENWGWIGELQFLGLENWENWGWI